MPTFPNKARMGDVRKILNDTGLMAVNNDAGRAPTNSDDRTAGYEVGSRWFFADRVWTCTNSDEGAAIWEDANSLALSADAKATEAQAVQTRRDFARWYLTDYLHHDDLMAALEGDIASQDEARVTAAIQQMHDDFMLWYSGGNDRMGKLIYPPVQLAINDELFSENFAQSLWDMTGPVNGRNRSLLEFDNTIFVLKNWTGRAAVRTSGYYAAHGITYPVPRVVFRWMQGAGIAIFPKITGSVGIRGQSSVLNDPVGVFVHSVSKPVLTAFKVNSLYNTNIIIENCVNGDFDAVDCFWGGYQPTEFGGGNGHIPSNATFSNVGSVVTCTQPIFTADHLGRYFGLAGASFWADGVRMVHWSTIASVDSPTQITLTTAPATNVTGKCASFEAMRATTSGTTWTMSASISNSLVGRPVTLVRASISGAAPRMATLNTVILSHSGATIEVAHAPETDVTDALLVFSPLMLIDKYPETAGVARTDNVGFSNLRLESTAAHTNSSIPLVLGNASTCRFDNAKLHGSAIEHNNFGGTACAAVLGHVNGVTFDGFLSQATRSPRYGAIIGVGGTMVMDLRGKHTVYPENNRSALVYLDPILPPESANVALYWGMSSTSTTFPTAQQVPVRMGANGRSNMILSYGSERRSGQAGSYMFDTLLGRVEASVYAGSGVADTTEADDTKLMRVGHGNLTGTTQPPIVADLNDVGVITNRRVRAEASTLNKPDDGNYIVELLLNSPNSYYQLAHRLSAPGIAIRRYNGTWSSWRFLQTTLAGNTASRPATPVVSEQYFDTTLGHPIWWNGTAWVDATGTTV